MLITYLELVFFIFMKVSVSVGWYQNGYGPKKQFYPRSNINPENSSVLWASQNYPQASQNRNTASLQTQDQFGYTIDPNQPQLDTYEHHKRLCMSLNGFTKKQRYICLKHPGLIWVMGQGASLGLNECIHQFQHEKWNCSSAAFIKDKSSIMAGSNFDIDKSLTRILEKGTKERAFLSATWAAGSVDKLTRACSLGSIAGCQCDPRRLNSIGADTKGQFYWSGCSDHITFGMRLTKKFLESADHQNLEDEQNIDEETKRRRRFSEDAGSIDVALNSIQKKAKSFMNIHNTKVGILAVWHHRRKECRCNGPSGTCATRFCYHKIGNFRNVGNYIKSAYDSAIRVSYRPEQNRLVASDAFNAWGSNQMGLLHNNMLLKRNTRYSRGIRNKRDDNGISKRVLVYLEDSPNYCHPDASIGHQGVALRECDGRNSTAPNSCKNLCCGHGFETLVIDTSNKCRCKFVWCCEVKCEICYERKTIFRCKRPQPDLHGLSTRSNHFSNSFYNPIRS